MDFLLSRARRFRVGTAVIHISRHRYCGYNLSKNFISSIDVSLFPIIENQLDFPVLFHSIDIWKKMLSKIICWESLRRSNWKTWTQWKPELDRIDRVCRLNKLCTWILVELYRHPYVHFITSFQYNSNQRFCGFN